MEEEQKEVSDAYTEARRQLAESAAAYIAAVDEYGIDSAEADAAYSVYSKQLQYFNVFQWL